MNKRSPARNASTGRVDFTMLTIGDRIRWLMEYREIKQVELAERIGVTQAAISNLVTDASRKPSAPTLLKIAAALECSPGWILDGEGDPFKYAPLTGASQVELINLFNNMDAGSKSALLAAARAMKK
jgi:transcriptional regulator with XRE-family HTH domain